MISQGLKVLKSQGPQSLFRDACQYAENYYGQSAITYYRSQRQLQARIANESQSLDDILNTVLDIKPGLGYYQLSALQLRDELHSLAEIVRGLDPKTVMEIGTAQGGTLYTWSRYLETPSMYISIDIPGRTFAKNFYRRRQHYFDSFDPDTDTAFVWQNSHLDETYDKVHQDLLGDEKNIDFLLIDGDHSYEGVKQDFETYKNLVGEGGVIALHDIVYHPNDPSVVEDRMEETTAEEKHLRWTDGHRECDVHDLWAELKREYETKEIISHPKQTWGGIGVVYI